MKLIYMWADGLKLFENNELEVDFTLQKLVRRTAIPSEVNEVLPDLFLSNIISFVGVNSSGKSTTLKMIDIFNNVVFNNELFTYEDVYEDVIELEAMYLIDEDLYCYNIIFKFENNIAYIDSYKIYKKKYLKTYYVNDYLFEYDNEDLIEESSENKLPCIFEKLSYYPMKIEKIDFSILKKYQKYLQCVIKILDNNVEKFVVKDDYFKIDLKLGESLEVDFESFEKYFSKGTAVGIRIFSHALLCLNAGSIYIVDDLSSFINRLVVEELIRLFQDSHVNRWNSTLIFATNYVELVDNISRTDCVYLVKKHHGIVVHNLSKVVARNEKLKSKYIYGDSGISVRMKKEIKKSLVSLMEEFDYES